MLLRTVSPTRVLLVGIHTENKRRTAGSSCVPKTSAIYVLEDVSIHLDIVTFELVNICVICPVDLRTTWVVIVLGPPTASPLGHRCTVGVLPGPTSVSRCPGVTS